MSKFILRPCSYGFNFSLVGDDDQTILRSQNYKTEDGVRRGLDSVKKWSAQANIEDATYDDPERKIQCPKYQIYNGEDGIRIRLLAINGQKIAAGVRTFADVEAAKATIAAARAAAAVAGVEEAAAE